MFKITPDQAADLLESTEYVEMIYKYFGILPQEFEPPYEWYACNETRELKLLRVLSDTDDISRYPTVFTAVGLNMCRLNADSGMDLLPSIKRMLNGLKN